MRQLSDANSVWGTALSSNGSLLYTTGVSFLSKWDVQRGARIASAPVSERVTRLVLSKDERSLILGASEEEGVLLRFCAETLAPLERTPAHAGFVKALMLLPRRDWLVSGAADARVMVWRAADLGRLKTLSHHSSWVWTLAHSRAEDALFSGGSDRSLVELSLPAFQKTATIQLPEWVMSLTLAPDEQTLFAGGQTSVFVVDRRLQAITSSFPAHKASIWAVLFDPTENALLTCSNDHSVALTSLARPHVQVSRTHHSNQVYALQRSGDLAITAGCDRKVTFFSLAPAFRELRDKLKALKEKEGENGKEVEEEDSLPDPKGPPSLSASTGSEPEDFLEEEALEVKKRQFGRNWVLGPWREGRLFTGGELHGDLSLSFGGVPKDIIGLSEEGFLVSDAGELFELDYENGEIFERGKVELF